MHWEKQSGRYPRDPRLGHRPGVRFCPTRANVKESSQSLIDLYTTEDGYIALSDTNTKEHNWREGKNVVILGGSVAMGLGASSNENTAAAQIEKGLTGMGLKGYRVVNAACGAYCSWQEVIRFTLEISNKKPDIVISISGWNDFVHSSIGDRYTGEWYTNHDRSIDDLSDMLIGLQQPISIKRLIKERLKRNTSYLNWYKWKLKRSGKDFTTGEIRWGYDEATFVFKPGAAKNYVHNMLQIKALTEAFGGKFLCLIQPELRPVKTDYPLPSQINLERTIRHHNTFLESKEKYFKELAEELREDVQEFSYSKLSNPEYFVDHCHLNDRGQKLLANEVIELLQNNQMV